LGVEAVHATLRAIEVAWFQISGGTSITFDQA